MGLPAARKTDRVKHKWASGDILEGSPNVNIGRLPAARKGDKVQHNSGTEIITSGEPRVRVNGWPAARVTDTVSCRGYIATGFTRVRIGMTTIGQAAPGAKPGGQTSDRSPIGQKMCQNAIKGRNLDTPNRTSRGLIPAQQSYSNCAVESVRQIVNLVKGKNLTEDEFLQSALDNNLAVRDPPNLAVPMGTPPVFQDGGTNYSGTQSILSSYNINSTVQEDNLNNIEKALSSGKGVIATVDAGAFYDNNQKGLGHAVLVTGLEYDDNGKITNVIVNDTGGGVCSKRVPIATWNKAVNDYGTKDYPALINVTDDPIF